MEEKKYCKIIQDLLPNYIEKLTNEQTNQFIENHLNQCKECKTSYENMKREIDFESQNKDKKAVKYFKKYNIRLRTLAIILLLILIIFSANVIRKMVIIAELSNKAETTINTNNYHRIIYGYEKDNCSKTEIFSLEDKKKIIDTRITDKGTIVTTTYAKKIGFDEWGNEKYSVNQYTETQNGKIEKKNIEVGIFSDVQNILYVENLIQLFIYSIPTSIKQTTYDGNECYYITNFKTINAAGYASGMYIDKNTGLILSGVAYEIKNTDGSISRWPAAEYIYEFGTVTEQDIAER